MRGVLGEGQFGAWVVASARLIERPIMHLSPHHRPVPVRIDLHCSSMTPDPSSSSVSDDRDPRPSPMEMETAMMATADDERQQQQEERQQRRRRRRRRDSSGRDAATAGAGGGGEGGRGGSQRGEEEGDGEEEEVYVARVDWLPDGFLAVQVQDRRQSRVRLLRACPRTGRSHLLLEERALEGLWVNLHHLFRCVPFLFWDGGLVVLGLFPDDNPTAHAHTLGLSAAPSSRLASPHHHHRQPPPPPPPHQQGGAPLHGGGSGSSRRSRTAGMGMGRTGTRRGRGTTARCVHTERTDGRM